MAPRPPATAVHVDAVPFWPQTRYQCGPAALASLLNHSGVRTTPQQLEGLVFLPGRRGSLQAELLAAPRRFDRIGYALPPSTQALQRSLDAQQPVLVLLNLGWRWWPIWHYAVLTGLDQDAVRLHSGTARDKRVGWPRFARQWAGSGRWAMVIPALDQTPAALDRETLLAAVAALETRFPRLAAQAYDAALARWPQDAALLFGSGTARLHGADYAGAAARLERLLRHQPESVPARNNLALALHGLGRPAQARALLSALLAELPPDSPWRASVLDSWQALEAPAPP